MDGIECWHLLMVDDIEELEQLESVERIVSERIGCDLNLDKEFIDQGLGLESCWCLKCFCIRRCRGYIEYTGLELAVGQAVDGEIWCRRPVRIKAQ